MNHGVQHKAIALNGNQSQS